MLEPFASTPAPPTCPAASDAMATLERWVRATFGIRYTSEQYALFEARIAGYCREYGGDASSILARLAAGDRATTIRLAEAVSTNHTLFFREEEIFETLAEKVIPTLPAGPIRVWSAAASSGDEAYSLAIALLESLGPSAATRIRVLGTDLSERQIRAAEQAVYPAVQLQRVSPERRRRWFASAGLGQFSVGAEARALCTFRRFNLTDQPWPFSQRFHIIFLRNVLYYFEPDMQRRVIEACYDHAEPGAFLVTSLTEPMLDLVTRWTPVQAAVFRRGA